MKITADIAPKPGQTAFWAIGPISKLETVSTVGNSISGSGYPFQQLPAGNLIPNTNWGNGKALVLIYANSAYKVEHIGVLKNE